jgi:hypothetical protein
VRSPLEDLRDEIATMGAHNRMLRAQLAAVEQERDAARAILEGRTSAPTRREFDALAGEGGICRFALDDMCGTYLADTWCFSWPEVASILRCAARRGLAVTWWAHDRRGLLRAWPAVAPEAPDTTPARRREFSFESATIGTCNHTKHRHGWWCVQCLSNIVSVVAEEDHPCRGEWRVRVGPVEGFGATRPKAWQAAIEALLMGGHFDSLHWPDTVLCECGHPESEHCPQCCWCTDFWPDLSTPLPTPEAP